jgi:DNA-binding IclR family transcriptional regulator
MSLDASIPGTQTVVRAVALLKAFTDDQPEMGLSELARSVGLNKATAFRLLSALEHEGLVAHDTPGGAYRLGPEAIALGARALRATDLRAAARPELDALARETGETADLEILDGGDVLVVEEVHGRYVLGTMLSVGTRWPAHATSTGKAILAHLPEAEAFEALGHNRRLRAATPKTLTDRETLRADLAATRARGYATADGELEDNFAAVGAPVFNHEGRVTGAISIGGPLTRLTAARVPELAALLQAAAGRISRRMGYKENAQSVMRDS